MFFSILAALGLVSSPVGLGGAPAAAQASAPPLGFARNEPLQPNFVNAEIESVARALAAATGRSIVVDPRVKGQITLVADRLISPSAAFGQFAALLRLQGFAMVDAGGIVKITPEADAKVQGGPVAIAGTAPVDNRSGSAGLLVTQIFKLNFETANNLLPILRPLIAANNTINVNPGTNALVITDYQDNLARIGRLIAALDVANATELEIVPLQHTVAADIAPIVLRLAEPVQGGVASQGQVDTSFKTTVLADARTNSLMVRAPNAQRHNLIKSVIAKLDTPNPKGDAGNIYVVPLKNADATKLAQSLRAAISGGNVAAAASPLPAAPGAAPAAAAPAATTGGQIQADVASNSLIITASEPQYRQIRAVIEQLDGRRAQVLVESLIAEVSNDKAAEFGIQWQGALGRKGDPNIGILGTNFGTGGNNILNLSLQGASGTSVPGAGGNIGLFHNTGGVYVLGMLARFLETTGEGNVLSTPQLLTLDNEEAEITVGQNVPFVTGQFTSAGGNTGGNVNPFQTIERKDVGLKLKVKPQISENGTIRMQILQESSNVDPASRSSPSGLITNKREIKSNVLVDDGGIVVIGGLIQDEFSGGEAKVPGVSEVPILGKLFKTENRNRRKSNLMVFLRPVVVRDAASAERISVDRYDIIRAQQEQRQPTPNVMLPIQDAPLLQQAPGTAPASSAPRR